MNIEIRGMYAGPPQADGARPGPDQEFYKADWEVPVLPAIGDTLMLPDGEGEQDVTVTERVIYPDRIEVWVEDGFGGWTKDDVARLFESAQRAQPEDGAEGLRDAARRHVGAYMRGDDLGPTVAALAKAAGLKGQGEAP